MTYWTLDRCTSCRNVGVEFNTTPTPESGSSRRNYWGRCTRCGISLCKEAVSCAVCGDDIRPDHPVTPDGRHHTWCAERERDAQLREDFLDRF